jgi:hypothetical protein
VITAIATECTIAVDIEDPGGVVVECDRGTGTIEVYQGEVRPELVTVKADGQPLPLTGKRLTFKVKELESDVSPLIELDSDTPTEIEITDAAAGEASIHLTAAHTGITEGRYMWGLYLDVAAPLDKKMVASGCYHVRVGLGAP